MVGRIFTLGLGVFVNPLEVKDMLKDSQEFEYLQRDGTSDHCSDSRAIELHISNQIQGRRFIYDSHFGRD